MFPTLHTSGAHLAEQIRAQSDASGVQMLEVAVKGARLEGMHQIR